MHEIALFPDTTVLRNFAAVDETGLLEEYLAGRGKTTAAVRREIVLQSRSVRQLAAMDLDEVFGEPIDIVTESAIVAVEHLRRDRFGGVASRPLEHLGESQTLYLLTADTPYRGSVFITDDFTAHRIGSRLGALTRDTVDIFIALAAWGALSELRALELIERMHLAGRTLRRRPQSVRELSR